jgi:hypothetical protein
VRRDLSLALALTAGLVALASLGLSTAARAPESPDTDVLTGEQVALRTHWRGTKPLPTDVPILVMAGHADSQAMEGAGTSGATVGLHGGTPMDARMRDELFWNLRVRDVATAPQVVMPWRFTSTPTALAFGRYPRTFRGGLGAPRRGISILEIGKLEGNLEQRLRNPQSRQPVIDTIARRIVEALAMGLKPQAPSPLSSGPDGGGSAHPETDPPANSGAG